MKILKRGEAVPGLLYARCRGETPKKDTPEPWTLHTMLARREEGRGFRGGPTPVDT